MSLWLGDVEAANVQLQKDATLYQTRCSQCHTLVMAKIPDNEVLPSEVLNIVQQMRSKPNSLIKDDEVLSLYQYAVFETYSTKKDLLKTKLNALPPAVKEQELSALKQALSAYK